MGRINIGSKSGLKEFFGDGSDGTIPNLNTVTSAPKGGTVSNLWDMNSGTVFTTGTLSSASDQVVFSIDFGNNFYIGKAGEFVSIKLWQASINTGASRNMIIQLSTDGVIWVDSNSTAVSTAPTDISNTFALGGLYRYARAVLKLGGSNCTLSVQGATINFNGNFGDTQTNRIFRIVEQSTLNGAAVIKQYTSYTLPVGYEHTTQTPCQGLIIYSQGDVTVNGVIDMSQKAGLAPNGNPIPQIISPFYYNTATTSSLLHFDNNITDAQGRTWTNNGSATFDATNKKFGTHAISFNGTNQWIDTPSSDDFSFGSDDFTIDFWMRPTSTGTTQVLCGIADTNGTALSQTFRIEKSTTNTINAVLFDTSSTEFRITGTIITTTNSWAHVTMSKINGIISLYINGIKDGEKRMNSSLRASNKLSIGRWGELASAYFTGQIDEFRIIKGKAMYTTNFIPPTSPYTYEATITDKIDAFTEYYQLTNSLQVSRGGNGGNGGYGGGYSGSTGRQTSVGIGGAGRQNAGGFGGGGSGGNQNNNTGGVGGSITNAEIGGGKTYLFFQAVGNSAMAYGYNGSGGIGSAIPNAAATITSGICQGSGVGGTGAVTGNTSSANSSNNSNFSGGFIAVITEGNIIITGSILANGGVGGNGTSATGTGNGGGGGAGGGAGGGVIGLYHKGTYNNSGTVQANGGAGGIGGSGTGGGETGGSGTSGGVGTILEQQL